MYSDIIHYSKFNPTNNMTVLVHSKHHQDEYGRIAKALMSENHVCCEQVGFIDLDEETGEHKLIMSGYEFCGNAAMSYVHFLASQNLLTASQILLNVSGIDTRVKCQIHKDNSYEVQMPQLAYSVKPFKLNLGFADYDVFKLHFGTYVHYVIPIETKVTSELCIHCEQFLKSRDVDNSVKTIGMMLFEVNEQNLIPLIYVPEIDSLIWESGCGSGTATIGNYLAYQQNVSNIEATINQPGGQIKVYVKLNKYGKYETSIRGNVSTVSTGIAYIEKE